MFEKITRPLKIMSSLGFIAAGCMFTSPACHAKDESFTCWIGHYCCKGWGKGPSPQDACKEYPGTKGWHVDGPNSSIEYCEKIQQDDECP